MQNFHEYLLQRKAKGEAIPETREELMQMYRMDRPKFLQPRVHKLSSNRR